MTCWVVLLADSVTMVTLLDYLSGTSSRSGQMYRLLVKMGDAVKGWLNEITVINLALELRRLKSSHFFNCKKATPLSMRQNSKMSFITSKIGCGFVLIVL